METCETNNIFERVVHPGVEIIKETLGDIDGNEGVVRVDETWLTQLGKMLQKYCCFHAISMEKRDVV